MHSCGVPPHLANTYNDIGDDGDDYDGDGEDYHGDEDEEGLGAGFELGLGLGLGVNWGAAGGVGCVCYDMGQRSTSMCFAVEGNNDNRGSSSKTDEEWNTDKKGGNE